jgi:glycosyltransferase involved in cell wall biosynthesis
MRDGGSIVVFTSGDFTTRENGSQVRVFDQVSFCRTIAPTTVYSYVQHPSHPWTADSRSRFASAFPDVTLTLEELAPAMHRLTRIKNALLPLMPGAAARIVAWQAKGRTPAWQALLDRRPQPRFLVNYVDAATLLNGLPAGAIVETHDVKFGKFWKRYGAPSVGLRTLGKLRSEMASLEQTGAVIAISPSDAAVFRSFLDKPEVLLVPGYQSTQPSAAPIAADVPARHELLFVGSENPFNVRGLAAFLRENEAWLAERRIGLAGKVCDVPEIQAIAAAWPSGNLDVLGFVDDLAPLYAAAKVVISPVDGTGLKIKVVEALAHGKPVLGSPHSRDALPPGYEGCVLPLDRAHAEALLDDPARLSAAEAAARAYYDVFSRAGDRQRLAVLLGGGP